MDSKNYLQDIHDIRDIMSRSTQFLSLSGLAGVLAGIYALGGAYVGSRLIAQNRGLARYQADGAVLFELVATAIVVLILSVATALVLTYMKAGKRNERVWNSSSRRLAVNFAIPFVTGGILALILLKNGYYGLLAPVMLIFYGLACVNASKFTFRDVRYLGLTITVLGLVSAEFIGYGIEFWALGFGVCHIVYGAIMHFKYDRKQS